MYVQYITLNRRYAVVYTAGVYTVHEIVPGVSTVHWKQQNGGFDSYKRARNFAEGLD